MALVLLYGLLLSKQFTVTRWRFCAERSGGLVRVTRNSVSFVDGIDDGETPKYVTVLPDQSVLLPSLISDRADLCTLQ